MLLDIASSFPSLCSAATQAEPRELVPEGRAALSVCDAELRQLLFAPSPRQAFAGLLLTRDLLALSPYRTEGEVKTASMFFGRLRLLREVITAPSPQYLLVGSRRVGKSSFLHRLLAELPANRPDLDPIHLDLLNISDPARVARKASQGV